jgi:ribosome biogenesis GTPase
LKGKIIKGIAGFYYVHSPETNLIYECKAKGIFRNQKIKPLVGDDVEIDTEDQPLGNGTITRILPRKNELIRPAVANVDQAMVIFAAAEPDPNLNLLDRFLIMMQKQQVSAIVCFNKTDIVSEGEISLLRDTYRLCGYEVVFTSMLQREGTAMLYEKMRGKTTVLAGPSGVGKSTFINLIQPQANMETGNISEKIKRGKHTTRHSELIYVEEGTYLMDTPGFSSLYIDEIGKEELKEYFVEFRELEAECRFIGCNHLNEPGCAVKDALKEHKISRLRYENYVTLYEELRNQKRY